MSEFLMEWDGDGEPFCQLRHRSPGVTVANSLDQLLRLCKEPINSVVLVVAVWSAIDWQQAEEAVMIAKSKQRSPRLILFFCNDGEPVSRALNLENPFQFPVWCRAGDGMISFQFRGAMNAEQITKFFETHT